MSNRFLLKNKTILITGASSGLGRSIAIECSKMGAVVVISGRNKERLQDTYDDLISPGKSQIVCDLTNMDSFNALCEKLPPLDGVVMCAGIPNSTPVRHVSDVIMREVFEVNAFSNFKLSRFLLAKNKINKGGSVVFVSSVASNRPYVGNSIYSASKAAIDSFAKVLALEVGYRKKIRVNCISPGIVPTKANDSAFSDDDLAIQEDKIPLGFGKPAAIANGCIFLLSEASEWITGIDLVVDGGQLL